MKDKIFFHRAFEERKNRLAGRGGFPLRFQRSPAMKITLYKKSGCPWAAAVIGFLNELNLPFEIRNVTTQPAYGEELQRLTGKCISPSLEIDGQLLADASVEQVAEVLEHKGIVL